jgi:ketosteroid isomerase-like protein
MIAGWAIALVVASWLQASAPAAAPDAPQLPSVELPPELARVLTDYEREWSARNAPGLARLFAEDGFVLAGGRSPVRGRAAIEKHYTGSGGPLALRALAYDVSGSTGYIIGGYATKPGEADAGKFTLTLRKGQDGRWLIVSDMDNSNRRPGPPGSPAGGLADAVAELRKIMDGASADWNRGDLDAFVAPYHEHATFMAKRGPIGIPDMRASFEKSYFTAGKPNQQLRYEQLNIVPLAADSAMMTGRFILSGGDRDEQSGWFTLVWVRTPAGWKIVHDHTS